MGQLNCRQQFLATNVYPAGDLCRFEEMSGFTAMFEVMTYFYIVSLILILILWILSACIKYRDFSCSFVSSNLLLLTLWHLTSVLDLINRTWFYFGVTVSNIILYVSEILRLSFDMNSLLTLFIFLTQSLWIAKRRKPVKTWGIYWITATLFTVFYSICIYTNLYAGQFSVINHYVMHCLMGLIGVIKIVVSHLHTLVSKLQMLFALCCCSAAKAGQAPEPSVSNARSRMGWSILLSIFLLLPLSFWVAAVDLLNSTSEMHSFIIHAMKLSSYLTPIVFVLSVILFIPAYRSVLFCSQGYRDRKVAETDSKLVPVNEPPDENTPIQANQSFLTVPHHHEDFGSVLTNPPNVTYYNPVKEDFGSILTNPPNVTPYNPVQPQQLIVIPPTPTPSVNQMVPIQQVYVSAPIIPVEQYQLIHNQPVVLTHQVVSAPVTPTRPSIAPVDNMPVSLPHLKSYEV